MQWDALSFLEILTLEHFISEAIEYWLTSRLISIYLYLNLMQTMYTVHAWAKRY